jgi:hypothetical protein
MITAMKINLSEKNPTVSISILLFIIPCLFLIKTLWSISTDAYQSFVHFQQAQGRYHKLRTTIPIWEKALRAKAMIPPGAAVQTSFQGLSLEQVAVRYILYPLQISKDWDYFIDFHSSISTADPSWQSYSLTDNITIFAKAGQSPLLSYPMQTIPSRNPLPVFLSVLLWTTANGFLTLRCIHIPIFPMDRIWYLAASYATGFLLTTGVLWIALLLGYPLVPTTIMSIWAGLFLLLTWIRVCQGATFPPTPIANPESRQQSSYQEAGAPCILFLAVIFLCVMSITLKPVISWDAMSHWVLKAHVLFYHQTLDFADTHHNYYPILWPLHIAAQFILTGQAMDEIAQWLTGTFFLCFLGLLKGGLHQWGISIRQQAIFLLMFIAFFYHELFFGVATAENGYLLFFTATTTSLLRWHHSSHRRANGELVLALLFGVGLSLFKLEGALTSILISLSLLLLYSNWQQPHRGAWILIGGFFASAGLAVLWIIWIKHHNFYQPIVHFQETFSLPKLFIMIKTLGKIFLQYHLWIILLLAFFYRRHFPNSRPWDMRERFLLYISFGLLAFSSFANAGWPAYRLETLMMESFPRLFYHALPALFLLWSSRTFR